MDVELISAVHQGFTGTYALASVVPTIAQVVLNKELLTRKKKATKL
jgi:hypothetical protein